MLSDVTFPRVKATDGLTSPILDRWHFSLSPLRPRAPGECDRVPQDITPLCGYSLILGGIPNGGWDAKIIGVSPSFSSEATKTMQQVDQSSGP